MIEALVIISIVLYFLLRERMDKVSFFIFLIVSVVEIVLFSLLDGLNLTLEIILLYIIISEISAWLYKLIDEKYRKKLERLL